MHKFSRLRDLWASRGRLPSVSKACLILASKTKVFSTRCRCCLPSSQSSICFSFSQNIARARTSSTSILSATLYSWQSLLSSTIGLRSLDWTIETVITFALYVKKKLVAFSVKSGDIRT